MFEKYGGQYGIPPIMLASFAMQESSCNPNTVGGAGEQGLMQITKEKCGGAPGGNCRDPDFNIRTGARYFAKTLGEKGGNLVEAVANYNGWTKGLTYAKATAAAKSGCCPCQNNCDYLHQFFNGWLQNIDAYNMNFRLGKYFNLDVCK
jgi:soluble lytic murein transglycosylase-like protein